MTSRNLFAIYYGWLTDDARRIPVSSRVKTDYGTFDIKLKRLISNAPAAK